MTKKRKGSTKKLTTRTTTAPMIVRAPTRDVTVAATVVVAEPTPSAAVRDVTIERDVIARLAFSKFLERGCMHGHALEDWLAAEAELRASWNATGTVTGS